MRKPLLIFFCLWMGTLFNSKVFAGGSGFQPSGEDCARLKEKVFEVCDQAKKSGNDTDLNDCRQIDMKYQSSCMAKDKGGEESDCNKLESETREICKKAKESNAEDQLKTCERMHQKQKDVCGNTPSEEDCNSLNEKFRKFCEEARKDPNNGHAAANCKEYSTKYQRSCQSSASEEDCNNLHIELGKFCREAKKNPNDERAAAHCREYNIKYQKSCQSSTSEEDCNNLSMELRKICEEARKNPNDERAALSCKEYNTKYKTTCKSFDDSNNICWGLLYRMKTNPENKMLTDKFFEDCQNKNMFCDELKKADDPNLGDFYKKLCLTTGTDNAKSNSEEDAKKLNSNEVTTDKNSTDTNLTSSSSPSSNPSCRLAIPSDKGSNFHWSFVLLLCAIFSTLLGLRFMKVQIKK